MNDTANSPEPLEALITQPAAWSQYLLSDISPDRLEPLLEQVRALPGEVARARETHMLQLLRRVEEGLTCVLGAVHPLARGRWAMCLISRGGRHSYESLAGLSPTLYSGLEPIKLEGQMLWHYARGSALCELSRRDEGERLLHQGLQIAQLLEHERMAATFRMSLGAPHEGVGKQAYWEEQLATARLGGHRELEIHTLVKLCKVYAESGNYPAFEACAAQLPAFYPRRNLLLEGAKLLQGLPNELPLLEEFPNDDFALMVWGLSDVVSMAAKAGLLSYRDAHEVALHILLRPRSRGVWPHSEPILLLTQALALLQVGQRENASGAFRAAYALIPSGHLLRPLLAACALKLFVNAAGSQQLAMYPPAVAALELYNLHKTGSLPEAHWRALSMIAPEALDLLTRLYPLELGMEWSHLLLRVSDVGAEVRGLPLPYYPSGIEMVWRCFDSQLTLGSTLRKRLERHRDSVRAGDASVVWVWQVQEALRRLSPPLRPGVPQSVRTSVH